MRLKALLLLPKSRDGSGTFQKRRAPTRNLSQPPIETRLPSFGKHTYDAHSLELSGNLQGYKRAHSLSLSSSSLRPYTTIVLALQLRLSSLPTRIHYPLITMSLTRSLLNDFRPLFRLIEDPFFSAPALP